MPLVDIIDGKACLGCDLTIINASALKEEMLSLLRAGRPVRLDLSAVDEMDSAGFQLLMMLRAEARSLGLSLTVVAHSPATMGLVKLYRAERQLATEDKG